MNNLTGKLAGGATACLLFLAGQWQALAAGPEPAGWFSGDIHVHRSCGSTPVTEQSIFTTEVNSNLAVISLLADMGNGEVQNATTDLPLVNGKDDPLSTSSHILHWDTEWHWDATYTQYPHQALGGHIVAVGLTNAHQIWSEMTSTIFNWAHAQGGLAGFAHFQYLDDSFPASLTCCTPIEYPVEVALGACDFIEEDVNGSDFALHAYYRLLNCGFRPGMGAASDNPCSAVVGPLVTYVQCPGGTLTYSNWIHGFAAGRTVWCRNGRSEFLNLTVNGGATPGDEVKLSSSGSVPVTVTWTATRNLSGTIEIVCNGVVVASQSASVTSSSPATFSTTIPFNTSGWICARRMDSPGTGHETHTAAVFVTVNNAPIRASATDAQFFVQWCDNLLQYTSPGGAWNSYFPTTLAAAQARYQSARAIYQQVYQDALGSGPLTVATTSLPYGAVNSAYSATLSATGGKSPYTWTITSGSLPSGLNLNPSTGVISGTPTAVGTFPLTVKVTDSSSSAQTANNNLTLLITSLPNVTLWANTTIPAFPDQGPDNSVEIGVKFRSDSAGSVAGIRFYKSPGNTGTHIGNLWTSAGSLLASATFSGETASGWQQVLFSSPVSIASNTVYCASYHCNTGHYSEDENYFASVGWDAPPLHALVGGASGPNGAYVYSSSTVFPTANWFSANYYVDVIFLRNGPAPTLTSISVTPSNPSATVGATQQFTATGTYSDNSTQNLTTQTTWASSKTAVATINNAGLASCVSNGTATILATLTGITGSTLLNVQAAPLAVTTTSLPGAILNTPYSATLGASGGTLPYTWSLGTGGLPTGLSLSPNGTISGSPTVTGTSNFIAKVTDSSSPGQTATKALSLTVSSTPTSIFVWPSTAAPTTADAGADSSVELGVKIRSDVSGKINGIRFYKSTANTGTHTGSLWSSAGSLLGSVTFSNETASGWQQANFGTPISITSNTVYVASYHATVGHYSEDDNFFATSGVDNPPLHALANGVSGPNGVYGYGANSTFPNSTFSSANYWVDVAFQVGAPPTLSSIAVTPANPSIFTAGTQQFTATGTYSDSSTQNLTSQVTWSSSNTVVATTSASGLATGVSAGTSSIAASLNAVQGSTTLTVKSPPTLTSIAVTPANPTNAVGATQQFSATGTYSDNSTSNLTTRVTWASSNLNVATITSAGLASSVSPGAAIISATLSNVTGSTTLTVKAPPTLTSLAVNPFNVTNTVGATQQFTATGTYSDNSTSNLTSRVTWASSNPNVATINSAGLASSGSPGASTISATLSGVNGTATLTVLAPPALVSIAVSPANPIVLVGATQQFTATGTYSDNSTQNLTSLVTWASSNAVVATINSSGLATSLAPGSTTISASSGGVAGTTVLTVRPQPLVITTASLPGGTMNSTYSASIAATGGTTPYTWSVTAGALPAGLGLNGSTGAITGSPTNFGTFNFTAQVTDSGTPAQTTNKAFSITISTPPSVVTIWSSSAAPANPDTGADKSVELGVKFKSDVNGTVTGIRFYKSAANTGVHVGTLWTSTGSKLVSATFANETTSGWQQVTFTTPISIASNTVYVASYHCTAGHYSEDDNYFSSSGVDNPPLHAPVSSGSSGNGLFIYNASTTFPNKTFKAANYWVDVTFKPGP